MAITKKLEEDVSKNKISGELAKEICNIVANAKEEDKDKDPNKGAEDTDSSEGSEPEGSDSGEE